jgi:hypothetical protein
MLNIANCIGVSVYLWSVDEKRDRLYATRVKLYNPLFRMVFLFYGI